MDKNYKQQVINKVLRWGYDENEVYYVADCAERSFNGNLGHDAQMCVNLLEGEV